MRDPRMQRRGSGFARRMNRRLDGASRPVVDLMDGVGRAAVATPVPVLGGTEDSHAYFPPANNTDAPVIFSEGAYSQMVPVSAAAWPAAPEAYKKFKDEPPEISDDEEYPDENTVNEPVLRHNGVRIQITEDGLLLLESQNQVRIQLVQGGECRVSIKDTPTEGRVALAGPTTDAINTLTDKVSELASQVAYLKLALETVVSTLAISMSAAMAPATAALGKAGVYLNPSQTAEDAISSSAFLVSSQTVEDTSFLYADE